MTEQLTAAEATDSERHPRVVLADDDVLLREGLASLLERSGLEVVGQAGDPVALLGLVREHKPELVIVDIRMPPTQTTEGLEAARQIREELPDTAAIVLSAYVQVDDATVLLASGQRSCYLLKSRVIDVEDFIDTLNRILKGVAVVDPGLVQELFAVRRTHDEDSGGDFGVRPAVRHHPEHLNLPRRQDAQLAKRVLSLLAKV
jgi:serine/threonine-protein kinase PknK